MPSSLILASGSKARASLLTQAGLTFEKIPAQVDEAAIKASLLSEGAKPEDVVDALAEYKALRIANKHPSSLVIGSDQILIADGTIYDKPKSVTEAKDHLRALSGKPHTLLSAAVIFKGPSSGFERQTTHAPISGCDIRKWETSLADNWACTIVYERSVGSVYRRLFRDSWRKPLLFCWVLFS